MSDPKIALCADKQILQNPEIIGLEGENLEYTKWLSVFCSALSAREHLQKNNHIKEVWVASSDEVESINLAAALKKDSADKEVYLLTQNDSGSLRSRTSAAGLSGSLNQQDFAMRYYRQKEEELLIAPSPMPVQVQTHPQLLKTPQHSQPLPVNEHGLWGKVPAQAEIALGKSAHILSVVSASGGTGKSTVAALAAQISQGLGHNTCLVDGDLQFGDMHFFLGEEEYLTLEEVINFPEKLTRLKSNGIKPAFLAAPKHLEQSEAIIANIPSLLDRLKSLFDVIVVNTGAFWSEQHALLLERSSTVLFLVDQRPTSLRASKHAIDLCVRCGIATHPFMFAINRSSRNAQLTSLDVSCALQGARVVELPDGGRDVDELLGAGLVSELIDEKNALCLSIESILLDLLGANQSKTLLNADTRKPKRTRRKARRKKAACL
jgi:pilus assembly protein CpaE